jgi:digeranylgeranylglycerophospholipid reductase
VEPDVVVIGGGPVGSTFAAQTASCSILVVEEHEEVGSPMQCAGLVHPRVVEMAHAEDTVLNTITGFRMVFPGGRNLEVRTNEAKAVVIDRAKFDNICSARAEDEGADILTGREFKGFQREGHKLRLKLEGPNGPEELSTSLLVGADGYKSRVGKMAGIGPAREVIRGIQVDLDVRTADRSLVEVLIGAKVAPGFFAWVLPCGDFTRVGLGVSSAYGAPSKYLTALIKKKGLEDAERLRIISGAIPIGPPKRTYADNILIVGDAAAQTKPLSGGGLYTGMRAARWAALTAVEALKARDLSAKRLSEYEDRWKADIGRELERGLLMRRAFVKMTDKKLDEIGRLLDRDDAKEVLATGDIDYPSKIASPLLRQVPSLIKFSPQLIGSLIRGANSK